MPPWWRRTRAAPPPCGARASVAPVPAAQRRRLPPMMTLVYAAVDARAQRRPCCSLSPQPLRVRCRGVASTRPWVCWHADDDLGVAATTPFPRDAPVGASTPPVGCVAVRGRCATRGSRLLARSVPVNVDRPRLGRSTPVGTAQPPDHAYACQPSQLLLLGWRMNERKNLQPPPACPVPPRAAHSYSLSLSCSAAVLSCACCHHRSLSSASSPTSTRLGAAACSGIAPCRQLQLPPPPSPSSDPATPPAAPPAGAPAPSASCPPEQHDVPMRPLP